MTMQRGAIYYMAALCIVAAGSIFYGCGGSESQGPPSAQTSFNEAMRQIRNHDYLEALETLDVIKLQYSGSSISDSAQFMRGECQIGLEKFILAAYEFNVVRRVYASSPLARLSQFKIADCYYHLSPDPMLDQDYTQRAIDEYQAYLEIYGRGTYSNTPDSLSLLATARIKELHSKLGEQKYRNALLYFKMDQYNSVIMYCDIVLDKFYDTEFADKAMLLKIKSLVLLKRYGEANREIKKFLSIFAASPLCSDVRNIQESIRDNVSK